MASGRLVNGDWMPAVDANGYPLPDAYIRVYVNRTTTLATVYSDEALTLPQANPVLADSSGQFPYIWQDSALMFSMELGSVSRGTIETVDDISPSSELGIINADLKQDDKTTLDVPSALPTTDIDRWNVRALSPTEFVYEADNGDFALAINRACQQGWAVELPPYPVDIKSPIVMRAGGNYITGFGGRASTLRINSATYTDMSGRAILKIPGSATEKQAGITDVGFEFVQPDAGRASFIKYPWAIDMVDVPRARLGNIFISGGWNGINAGGNTGGSSWGLMEIGCANIGLQMGSVPIQSFAGTGSQTVFTMTLPVENTAAVQVALEDANGLYTYLTPTTDYVWTNASTLTLSSAPSAAFKVAVTYGPSLDFPHIDVLHSWPFGFGTAARLAGYWDSNTTALRLGRCDGIDIGSLTDFAGKIDFLAEPKTGEGPFGVIHNLELDSTYARLDALVGRMSIGAAYLSASGSDAETYAIKNRGNSSLVVGAATIAGPPSGTVPFIQNSAYLAMTGGNVQAVSLTTALARSTGGFFQFNDFNWLSGTNQTRTAAALRATAGRAHFKGNLFPYVGSGGGPQVRIDLDDAHIFAGNSLIGWDVQYPASGRQGVYGPNAVLSAIYGTNVTSGSLYCPPQAESMFLTASVPISVIEEARIGRSVTMTFGGPVQFTQSSTIKLQGGKSWVFLAGDSVTFVNVNQVWYETARSLNHNATFRTTACTDNQNLGDQDHDMTVFLTGAGSVPAQGSWPVLPQGTRIWLHYDGSTTIVNGSTFKTKTGSNIVTAAGLVVGVVSDGSKLVQIS